MKLGGSIRQALDCYPEMIQGKSASFLLSGCAVH